jgi:hypothetical protein
MTHSDSKDPNIFSIFCPRITKLSYTFALVSRRYRGAGMAA